MRIKSVLMALSAVMSFSISNDRPTIEKPRQSNPYKSLPNSNSMPVINNTFTRSAKSNRKQRRSR